MTKPSAAQEVADWLQHQAAYTEFTISQYWPTQLLREDRERRQMERAIVAYLKDHEDWKPIFNDKAAIALHKIASRLARKEKL